MVGLLLLALVAINLVIVFYIVVCSFRGWKRGHWRFSLRVLLGLLTFTCIVLGLYSALFRRPGDVTVETRLDIAGSTNIYQVTPVLDQSLKELGFHPVSEGEGNSWMRKRHEADAASGGELKFYSKRVRRRIIDVAIHVPPIASVRQTVTRCRVAVHTPFASWLKEDDRAESDRACRDVAEEVKAACEATAQRLRDDSSGRSDLPLRTLVPHCRAIVHRRESGKIEAENLDMGRLL